MTIRIPEHELKLIIAAFKNHFSSEDHLWLFGSRVDPNKRGGDLDFYVETTEPDVDIAVRKKMVFVNELWRTLGDQQIDVVINILALKKPLPIYEIAKSTGVQLI